MANSCSICQEEFKIPKFLQCGHTFCKSCLDFYISSSFRKEFIVCPLCRSKTPYSAQGAERLMDNYFADTAKADSISVCSDCHCVSQLKLCEHCRSNFCDTCLASHIVIIESCRENTKKENDDLDMDTVDDDGRDSSMGLQGFFMSDSTPTKFCFELKGKIIVPNNNQNMRSINLNVSVLVAYDVDKCIVAPHSSNELLYYNIRGEEMRRIAVPINVEGIVIGMRGYPLLLDDRTNYVYEFEYGTLRQILQTIDMHPFAITSLNNGRIVLVGQTHSTRGTGMLQVYEYHGQLVRSIHEEREGNSLGILRSVAVNLKSNDMYVGDPKAGMIHCFRENGILASSYFIRETLQNVNIGNSGVENLIGPIPICYSEMNDAIVASCICIISRSILVLSPDLVLLGFFSSQEPMGIPGGLSVDEKGQLYIGDGIDGVIRVFENVRVQKQYPPTMTCVL